MKTFYVDLLSGPSWLSAGDMAQPRKLMGVASDEQDSLFLFGGGGGSPGGGAIERYSVSGGAWTEIYRELFYVISFFKKRESVLSRSIYFAESCQ